jgi:predicted MFS family arabinose efflux permease
VLALLRRNRDFRTLWTAQVISYMGDWFATVALFGLVRDQSGSDLLSGLVFVVQSLPIFFASPFAGPVADRFDRRTVMICCSVVQVVAAGGFLLAHHGIWIAFAAQTMITTVSAFFAPASQAALPNLVEPEDLPAATSLMSASWGAMLAIGAGLGGLFTEAFGRTAAFMADGVSFAVVILLVLAVRRPMSAPDTTRSAGRIHPLRDSVEGLQYARRERRVLALLLSKAGFGLSAGLIALVIILAEDRWGIDDGGRGLLLAVRGAGSAIGPVFAHRISRRGIGPVMTACGVSALVNGAGYLFVPWSMGLAVATTLVFVAHLGSGTQWTLSTYGLQATTQDEIRGRIFATDFALVTLTISLSTIAAGALSDQFGPGPIIVALAVLSMLWGALYLAATRSLRAAEPGSGTLGTATTPNW